MKDEKYNTLFLYLDRNTLEGVPEKQRSDFTKEAKKYSIIEVDDVILGNGKYLQINRKLQDKQTKRAADRSVFRTAPASSWEANYYVTENNEVHVQQIVLNETMLKRFVEYVHQKVGCGSIDKFGPFLNKTKGRYYHKGWKYVCNVHFLLTSFRKTISAMNVCGACAARKSEKEVPEPVAIFSEYAFHRLQVYIICILLIYAG